MSKFKNPSLRYNIINRELRRWPSITTHRLKNIVEKELDVKVSLRTIQKDLRAMMEDAQLGFNAPIEHNKRDNTYSYSDPGYSILNFGLREEEITAMKFYAACLNLYSDYSIFKSFSSAITKIVEGVNVKNRFKNKDLANLIIQTDTIPNVKGSEFISFIINAISEAKFIQFDYVKFNVVGVKQRELAPYMLKEYKNRWYVLGILKDNTEITTFCLDRASNLVITETEFIKKEFDYEKYFAHSFGITTPNDPVEKIVLRFLKPEAPYIKTLPIHSSQKIEKDTSNYTDISIRVIPSYELFEFILGKSPDLIVISPAWIKNKITKSLQKGVLNNSQK
jgi:predicted DNA-binding transcriptional regulator YafY